MTWTLGDLDNRVAKLVDDPNNVQWTLLDEVRVAEAIAFRREWRRILNAYNTYRFGERSVTTDANGQFLLTALDSGAFDAKQIHYRILAITDGALRRWTLANYTEWPTASHTNVPSSLRREYWVAGSSVQIIPVEVGTTLTVGVNHHPPSITALLNTNSVIDFPEDYEMIVAKHAASILLSGRAGSEADAGAIMMREADTLRVEMMADLRVSADPQYVRYNDNASDWSG